MDKTISIIIPTFNEKDNIIPLVERIHSSLAKYNYEIVFIDDDSKDGTAGLASGLTGKYPVKVIVRKNKRGLASAVVDGLSQANGEMVAVMDADLQHPPEVLPDMLKTLENHDFVMASRYIKGGSPGKWPLTRRTVSLVANLLALPLAFKVKDRMSGFFAFKRSAVNPALLNPLGWKIGLEILIRNQFKSVTEVPYTFALRARGSSKLSRRIIWQYLQQLVRLYLYKFQILNFMIVGGIGYVINIALYSLLTLLPSLRTFEFNQFGKDQPYYLPPFVVSSLVAIISNYLMNRAWTFKGWSEQKAGIGRYLFMGLGTLLLDMGLLFILVEYGNLAPIPAAALAIFVVFIVRFIIARSWVWKKTPPKK
ncbi:MAG: glycosyltransferase family 2 protein [Dehalococcoidales bacterium]|nr:glycosyltransferase family 2 protein [Dehalococcoidales bacterium]